MNYMDENICYKDFIKLNSKLCLVSRYHFIVNAKSMENLEAKMQIFMTTNPWLSVLCHSLLLSFSLG